MDNGEQIREGLYPIRVVIKLTGLTADTIRVWERRYGAVTPERTDGNTRMYSAGEVRRLIKLREAIGRGNSIKKIAGLPESELDRLIAERDAPVRNLAADLTRREPDLYRQLIEEYLAAILRFDARRAHQILARAAALLDSQDFIRNVMLPILRDTGHAWHDDRLSVAHEHLVSMQARSLLVKMADLVTTQPGSQKIVVTTPEGHLHEFGALAGALIAATRGFEPIYLGPNLPEEDIVLAVDMSRANVLLLSIVRDLTAIESAEFDEMLTRFAARVETWVGIPENHAAIRRVPGVRYLTSFDEYDLLLTRRTS
ncbi:MAG: MerR family transcriptional regulator [Deltaproteobacteria bacterium]|nr:MerR family transcriptional regulator [Deltaproteobacteria bacterium]